MRRSVRVGAVLAAAALVTTMAGTSAEAGGKRGKLKICWDNEIPAIAGLELDAVADGDSFRSKTLDSGECKKWSVRTGQYKITIDNAEEFYDAIWNGNPCGYDAYPEVKVEVTRNGDDYDVIDFGSSKRDLSSTFETNVQKERTTKVEFTLFCEPNEVYVGN